MGNREPSTAAARATRCQKFEAQIVPLSPSDGTVSPWDRGADTEARRTAKTHCQPVAKCNIGCSLDRARTTKNPVWGGLSVWCTNYDVGLRADGSAVGNVDGAPRAVRTRQVRGLLLEIPSRPSPHAAATDHSGHGWRTPEYFRSSSEPLPRKH